MPHANDPRVYTNELLRNALLPTPGQRILVLGVTANQVGAWAEAVGADGSVVAVEHWLPDWRALQQERERGRHQALQPIFAANLDGVEAQPFDACAIDIAMYPSNRALLRVTQAAAERLKPEGLLFAAGPKDVGILSFTKRLETLFGNAEPLAYRKGQRVVVARKSGALAPLVSEADEEPFTASLRGQTFTLEHDPGVFAKGAVDEATAMLIDALVVAPDERVLDLGSGAGIVGMVAARLAPQGHVTMTDAEAAALDLSHRNCDRNGLTNVTIAAADVVDAIATERFTLVACNPPFHQRHDHSPELALRFMRGAASVLLPGGKAYFVANRFLTYESKLRELFGNVTEIAGDDRYKVLRVLKNVNPG
jgi:16S rRNA (guanine1207-N2)-methyltransferase